RTTSSAPPFSTCSRLSVLRFTRHAALAARHLSLHDALPICAGARPAREQRCRRRTASGRRRTAPRTSRTGAPAARGCRPSRRPRSEEHTSELQSLTNIVCRLLLEKKKLFKCCHNRLHHNQLQ